MTRTRWLTAGLCAVLLAAGAPGQGPARGSRPPAGWEAFTRAFDAYMDSDRVVGASALVMRDGRVLGRHDRGFADRARHEPAGERTIYHWASITKTLTAVAVMQLRDRGRLSLDDRVVTWVPELRQVHDTFGSIDDITIRMLLSHSAGFQGPTWPYRTEPWQPFEPTRWEQLVAMLPYQQILFRPGSRFGYSNPAFIYLARIIEHITGDPYETYVQKNIWLPLGMTTSYFGVTPHHLAPWRSNNYTLARDGTGRDTLVENGREFDPGITIPNGGWNAPLGDVAAWVAFLSGATPRDTVLQRSSLEEMWRPLFAVAADSEPPESIGLSLFVLPRGGGGATLIGHTGHQAGFQSFFYFNPRTRAAVIAALNTDNEAHADASRAGFLAVREAALALIER